MRPFLKWAGNKYRVLQHIKKVLPAGQRLIEPFVGSGAVFLNTEYDAYLLADSNPDLISLYQILQTEGQAFIDFCQTFFTPENNQPDQYYAYRAQFNETDDKRLKAALFLYMNKHGYNGLCRYNAKGGFNVPFGRYKKQYFPQEEMVAFYQHAQNSTFIVADFEETMRQAKIGDVIYCDPPYVPLSDTANFTSYSADKFNLTQQTQLAELASEISQQGIPVIISNHNTKFTRQAYAGAKFKKFTVQRYISCDSKNRNKAKELLAIFK